MILLLPCFVPSPVRYRDTRSGYFKQIEDDVATHANAIWQAKAELEAFECASGDMQQLIRFHSRIEGLLDSLSDESQVRQGP